MASQQQQKQQQQHTFGARSTAQEVADTFADRARGRVALVTGASTGLGFETARALLSVGAVVVVAARPGKTADTCERLRKAVPTADVRPLDLDLSSLASVRAAAAAFLAMDLPLHFLVNNAGVMAAPLSRTADGFEQQFGVNHLGHFLLTHLLYDKLKASAPARVVNLSSIGHCLFPPPQGILFDDLSGTRHYDPWERYGQSKLANILHAQELQRRFDRDGADVVCTALHPGNILETELSRQQQSITSILGNIGGMIKGALTGLKNMGQGVSTTMYCTLSPDVVKGEYYMDCAPARKGMRHRQVGNAELARALWVVSCDLVGVPQQ